MVDLRLVDCLLNAHFIFDTSEIRPTITPLGPTIYSHASKAITDYTPDPDDSTGEYDRD